VAKMISILMIITILGTGSQAQNITLVMNSDDAIDTLSIQYSQLDSILDARLEAYKGNGNWDASIELVDFDPSSELIIANLKAGEIVSISNIHFAGLSTKDARYLKREYTMGVDTILADKLRHGEARINGIGYKLKNDLKISRDTNDYFHLDYRVQYKPELKAEALASFNQSATADTVAWFGHVNIYVPNFDGKGKSFSLQWRRLRTNSESFALGYGHPWVFDLPLKGVIEFGREVIDGNYQLIRSGMGLDWSLDWERSLIFQYENLQSLITHEGNALNPQWKAHRKQLLGLGYRQTNLNSIAHSGLSLRTTLSQEINFEPSAVRRLTFRSEAELSVNDRLYLSQKTQMVIQNQNIDDSDPSTLEALGGVNSVRGYDENYLRSQSILSLQHDLHLILGGNSHFLVLLDLGLYTESKSLRSLSGYGVGFQLRSGRGPLRLFLASHNGVNVRNSFLHLEYSGGIPWIDR